MAFLKRFFFWFCLLAGVGVFAVLSAGVFFLASGGASGVGGGGHLCSMAFGYLEFFAFSVKCGFQGSKNISNVQAFLLHKVLSSCTTGQ